MSLTDQIYHRAPAFHFYFYSNNDLTSAKGPRKQTTELILRTGILGNSYDRLNGKRGLSANNAQFVSVDLIEEKNQVILE